MSAHSQQIDKIYKLASQFRGLVPGGISQVGEVYNSQIVARKPPRNTGAARYRRLIREAMNAKP